MSEKYSMHFEQMQEGTGNAIEEAMRRDRESMVGELVVASDGKASIKTVYMP